MGLQRDVADCFREHNEMRARIAALEAVARETERHLCFSILAASPNRMGGQAPYDEHCKHAEGLLAKVRALD